MNKFKAILLILLSLSLFSCKKDDNKPDQNVIDLFVWAGQSNAQGRQGDAALYPADPDSLDKDIKFNWTLIDSGKSDGWTTLQPQDGVFAAGHFGPEITFARKLAQANYKPAIFKYTKGATSIFEHWRQPGQGGFYDDMIADLKIAVKELEDQGYTVKFKGFIWIQGESDSNSDAAADAYDDNLNSIITGMRNYVNDNSLPIILGVDEQYFNTPDHQRLGVLNAHQRLALSDDKIKFVSMYGYPKADLTHLTPAGLISYGEDIFDVYQILTSGAKPAANSSITSGGNVVSVLSQRAWGQSFSPDQSGYVRSITFSAASDLDNSATLTLHNGADCTGDELLSQNINAITTGDNTITLPGNLYLEKEQTYFIKIASDTPTGWRIHYSSTNNVIGILRTNRDGESDLSCRRPFPSFDMNFSVVLGE